MASSQPPPPYLELELSGSPQPKDAHKRQRVNRKPVPSQTTSYLSKSQDIEPQLVGAKISEPGTERLGSEVGDLKEKTPGLPPRPDLSLETSIPTNLNDGPLDFSPGRSDTGTSSASATTPYGYGLPSANSLPSTLSSTSTRRAESISPQFSESSRMKQAYEEARHFAGGLIQRPTESTKHLTILRHSHGLVFYQGSSTTLAISIFSDEPLPPDRTLWLQSKGWSGRTGMRAKALMGVNGNWLNVTPTLAVGTEQLNPTDERAWQRDFQKFRKKAHPKIRDRHLLRETAIVRIPAEAGDGYFQIVLCAGDKKKVICASPSFRVLSTSTSPSSIRGASLSTLPFELGAMALSTYANSTVGTAVSTVTSPFQNQIQQYMLSFWTRKAASAAYGVSGAESRVDSTVGDAQSRYEQSRDQSFTVAERVEAALEEGPQIPYPIDFFAGCESETSGHVEQFILPQMTLSVPDNISLKLHGHYFGWARSYEKAKQKSAPIDRTWIQAILSAIPVGPSQLARADVMQANKKTFTLRVIEDSEEMTFAGSNVEIRVMGFIRPDEPAQQARLEEGLLAGQEAAAEASMVAEVNDVSMAQGILGHPSWAPDGVEREMAQDGKAGRLDKLKKGYADTRLTAQKQIDRVPFNKVGVRMPTDGMRDKTVTNGFYVVR